MQGWIKLHRQIAENPLWFSEPFTRGQAWIDLLLIANHKKGFFYVRGNKIDVDRGQVGMSEDAISTRWQWSRGKLRRFLSELEKQGQVVQQKSRIKSLITLVNYEKFQGDSTTDSTTDGQQTVQQTVQQTDTNKNVNNKKNVKNEKKDTPLTPQLKDDFYLPEGIDPQTWKDFEDMRNKIKAPLTPRAKILMIDKLKKINTETNQDPNDLLNQSIMNCWKSVFPIKDHNPKGNQYGNQGNNAKPSLQDIIRDQAAEFAKSLER